MHKISFLTIIILGIFSYSCDPDEPTPNETNTAQVIIDSIYQVQQNSIKIDCSVIQTGNSFVSNRGICLSKNSSPDINDTVILNGNSIGNYTVLCNNLEANTLYFIRAFATNSEGTVYSNEQSFTTLSNLYTIGNGVTDVEGNFYESIIIVGQEWMRSNLKTTKYANGDTIQKTQWIGVNFEAMSTNYNAWTGGFSYGVSYNHFAVIDSRNVCPNSWHVPTVSEWNTLITNLGGSSDIGFKMKKVDDDWISNNSSITNSSGFSALPGGYTENQMAKIYDFPINGYWWSSTATSSTSANAYKLDNSDNNIDLIEQNKGYGSSIRCIKD